LLSGTKFADFGTRRRRSYEVHDLVIAGLKSAKDAFGNNGLVGTSNVHFAMKHGLRPIGTMAHEWIMGVSALESLRHANRYAMRNWAKVYGGSLGIALPDTFGSNAFFEDFDGHLARLFDGVRHDSGDPAVFAEKAIAHYEKLRIDPRHKVVVFTDGLTPELALKLDEHYSMRIGVSFGIGTNFTNDFPGSKPLNMVIKLARIDNIPVVKLSDEPGKAIGDADAMRVAKWTFSRTPLDPPKE
jgi:nicotinate phosphoribosyltransferase